MYDRSVKDDDDQVVAVCVVHEDPVEVHADLQEEGGNGHEGEGVHVVVDPVVVGGALVVGGRAGGRALVVGGRALVGGDCASSFFPASDSSSLVLNMDVQKCMEMNTGFIHVNG
ncbi:hypothetical protein OIU85_012339 [Salix viminalis]|uniref:Uncharacterized protein n=1 Tax=Salix viminalis TaxID=40686 RepID=A0A9Q0NP31_SALVM|nr:hypothetical protein OIU85_012339 [Salix viminalis]